MKSAQTQLLDHQWSNCPTDRRLMGIDHGTKTLGLALCDPAQGMATPLKTIKRGKFHEDVKALEKVIADYGVAGLIIGWPVSMDGKPGPRAQSVWDYMQMLAPKLNLWWALWDERLSTDVAKHLMNDDLDLTNARKDKAVDALAAQAILQDALNFMKTRRNA